MAAIRAANPIRQTCTGKPNGKQGIIVEYRTFQRTWPNLKFKFKPFGYKDPVFKNGYTFGEGLVRRGFVQIGCGHFSSVFAKPGSDRVIKVNRKPDNWIDYAHWGAQQGFAGGLSPMVYSYKIITGTKSSFQVSVVERMDKVVHEWGGSCEDKKSPLTLVPTLMHSASEGNDKAKEFLQQLVPGMGDFLSQLKTRFDGQRLDLHGENIMTRKDGSVCVTDPVCDYAGSTIKRLRAGDFSPVLNLFKKEYYGLELQRLELYFKG